MNFSTEDIFRDSIDDAEFEKLALELFQFQSKENEVYAEYLKHTGFSGRPASLADIPFMPIELFKTHRIISGNYTSAQLVFTSSGTTGDQTSRHYVPRPQWYDASFRQGFLHFWGKPEQYHILGLLPSYKERSGSSLIYMVDALMQQSGKGEYYLYNHDALYAKLEQLEIESKPSVLFGVSYALLDFADRYSSQFKQCTVIETGGMKGNRKEITKHELHSIIKEKISPNVSSEYGMTELLSQAYAVSSEKFQPVPWMKLLVRDVYDPFSSSLAGKGALNIIDLANIDSCAFIATQDIGTVHDSGFFTVEGRIDNTQIRGCNLLVQ